MPGVHHFPNGVTKLKYLTARELNTILRVEDGSFYPYLNFRLTNNPVFATASHWCSSEEEQGHSCDTYPTSTCMCCPFEPFSSPYLGYARVATTAY